MSRQNRHFGSYISPPDFRAIYKSPKAVLPPPLQSGKVKAGERRRAPMKERVGNVSGTTSRHRTTTAILVTPMPRMSLNAWLWPMLVPAYLDDSGPTLALTKSHCSLHSVTAASERPKLYKDARICDQGAELVALDLMFGHEHVQVNASTGGCNGKLLHGVAKGDQFLFDF